MKKTDKGATTGTKTNKIVEKSTNKRRKFLAGMTTGAAAAGVASSGNWIKPVVDSVVLPAHAQTSGLSTGLSAIRLQSRIDEMDEFSGYDGVTYTDGTHTFDASNDDDNGFDNFTADYSALFQPVQGQSVSVNLDVNVDIQGPGSVDTDGILSQTSSANVPVDGAMRASFSPIDMDMSGGSDNTIVTVSGTVQADGYASRRVTYVLRR